MVIEDKFVCNLGGSVNTFVNIKWLRVNLVQSEPLLNALQKHEKFNIDNTRKHKKQTQ